MPDAQVAVVCDERYPTFTVGGPDLLGDHRFDKYEGVVTVDAETAQRWREAQARFNAMQDEVHAVMVRTRAAREREWERQQLQRKAEVASRAAELARKELDAFEGLDVGVEPLTGGSPIDVLRQIGPRP